MYVLNCTIPTFSIWPTLQVLSSHAHTHTHTHTHIHSSRRYHWRRGLQVPARPFAPDTLTHPLPLPQQRYDIMSMTSLLFTSCSYSPQPLAEPALVSSANQSSCLLKERFVSCMHAYIHTCPWGAMFAPSVMHTVIAAQRFPWYMYASCGSKDY